MTPREHEGKIRELAEPVVEAEGMELVLVECLKMKSRWVVRLFLDKEDGITLDDCAVVSNQLGDILDIHDVPPGAYTLEVSSPGLDRPLDRDRDFLRYRGAEVSVRLDEKLDGSRNFRGKLIDFVDEDGGKALLLDVMGTTRRIPRDKVIKAHLVGKIESKKS
jgi:ribosome maturation factor RimP